MSRLATRLSVTLARRDQAIERWDRRIREVLVQLTRVERLTIEEALAWSGATLTKGEARRLRVLRYHETTAEQAVQATRTAAGADAALPEQPRAAAAAFVGQAHALLAACSAGEATPAPALASALAQTEDRYQALKAALLDAGAAGAMNIDAMEAVLGRASALRRGLEQAAKAARLSASPALEGS